jgi:hypothetical protein
MHELLAEVSRLHFPYAPASPEEIEAFEQRLGWSLDPDLRAFYLHCNGAELFKRLPDSPFHLLPLSEVVRARVAILNEDDDAYGPASWYAFCYVQDGDYVLLDMAHSSGQGRYPILDGWHEGFPNPTYCKRIASSFAEFLARALSSNGEPFWLDSQGVA